MQKKLFIYYLIVLLFGISICGVLLVEIILNDYNVLIEQRLVSNTQLISQLVDVNIINVDSSKEALSDFTQKAKKITDARITIIGLDGHVISDTDSNPTTMENHKNRPEVITAFTGKIGVEKRYSNTLKVDFLYIAEPIYRNSQLVAILRLSTPINEIKILMTKLYTGVLVSIIVALIAAAFLGYRMSIRMTKPIKEMTEITHAMSEGSFDKKIKLKDKDEIGILADSINHMASTLRETIDNLSDKNVKMESILSSVVNGIIAIDANEKILFINPEAIKMMDIEETDIVGKKFLQIVRNNQIDNFLKNIIKQKSFSDMEFTINFPYEKNLKIYTNPIKSMESEDVIGIIITIQDITDLRKLERMRTEFVANVSHELKTPLTSIKGFVETLKSGAIEDREIAIRFLNIIEDEADRLHRLIADILALSELETKKVKGRTEKIDVNNIACEVVSILDNQAKKKEIDITVMIQPDIMSPIGDPDRFKQMLINLIDNAINYTQEKGSVVVAAENYTNKIIVSVKDNGIGIPEDHIPRLFERFYRIDKARSRKVGGTGLGLAIVKHIVKSFNGEIEVISKVGEGTEFKITIPVKA